ncbi:MAG: MSMEG_1061 family FMN-dependent PPOX-type flavoprotein [Xanthobacter sp.]
MTLNDTSLSDPDLGRLYDSPKESIQKGVVPELLSFHVDYLARATFFCLATGRENGLDASPRGGPPGFVRVLDSKTVAFADWPGNNRIESMRNLAHDNRMGMLFLFPGLEIFMRINGRGRITDDAPICAMLTEGGKTPKTAIIVAIDEVLFHCGKAINRAKLWDPASQLERKTLPTPGQMVAAMTKQDDTVAKTIDADYDKAMRTNLYG